MSKRSTLIEKLVFTQHLSVEERKSLGSEPVLKSEIASKILSALETYDRFPLSAAPWRPGECVFEGLFLEVIPDGTVRLWWQRALAKNPYQLAGQGCMDFTDSTQAIEEFIAKEWTKGDIDGVPFAN